jgi:hypothetical protein
MQQPLKQLARQVDVLTQKYRQAKIQVMLSYKHTVDVHDEGQLNHKNFLDAFNYILDSMVPENKEIIINDFIERKQQNWWLDLYARSTYYRQKNKALKELLSFINS